MVNDVTSGIGSIQCLYYYGFTSVDASMPAITDAFRSHMAERRPERIVLLCPGPQCKGAEPALRRAGYRPQLQSEALLASNDVRMWVKIYRVDSGAV